jgi:hypothetical protein
MGVLVWCSLKGCIVIDRMLEINLFKHALQEASAALIRFFSEHLALWSCF